MSKDNFLATVFLKCYHQQYNYLIGWSRHGNHIVHIVSEIIHRFVKSVIKIERVKVNFFKLFPNLSIGLFKIGSSHFVAFFCHPFVYNPHIIN